MRLLFELDKQDYGACTHFFVRNSARSIIVRDGKIAMIHSLKYGFYKFPGGGIEKGEDPIHALIRETREEAYTLEYVDPATAIEKNRNVSGRHPIMLEREARVLELLIAEGILHSGALMTE